MGSKIGKQKVTNFVGGDVLAFLRQSTELYDKVVYEFTNYTSAVITPKGKYVFHPGPDLNKPFHVFQKLKKQIKDSGKDVPEVNSRQITWFHFVKRKWFPEEFEIVDLNGAYATVLHRSNVIDDEMYKTLISGIPKHDRLSAVGFLGTKKSRVIHVRGQQPVYEVETSEMAKWFFWCCYVTGEIMKMARKYAFDDYLFFWVDGIAVRKGSGERVMKYIRSLGYPCKVENVTRCTYNGNKLEYYKDGKRKILMIPQKRIVENKQAVDFINELNIN